MYTNMNWYLCNYDKQNFHCDNDTINKLWSGQWLPEVDNANIDLLATDLSTESINKIVKTYMDTHRLDHILHFAIGSFLKFCDQNWFADGASLETDTFLERLNIINVPNQLQQDSVEICTNIHNPELLLFSLAIFKALCSIEENLLHLWWYFRCRVTHQRILEDASASLYSELEVIVAKLSNVANYLSDYPRLRVLLYAEISQAYLMYGRVQKAEEYLRKAKEIAGLRLELTGVLGKRTKFQQVALPQLALVCELDESIDRQTAEQTHGSLELPPRVELQDDVRLNSVHYNEKLVQVQLPSLEQTLCLLTVQYLQKAQPKDDLMVEELQPYIELVLSQTKGAWCSQVCALLLRCHLEASNKRTVERAMMQCEAIVNHKYAESSVNRLSYLWASGLKPNWTWRQQLADLYLSLGLVKAALEEYQRLQLWEDVIVCYTILQLRHKAAEVIQQQIDIKPTVKLYCLLGDATDDIKCYETAWDMSGGRSSRAQRHWGNYLFNRKMYDECIPHFEKSLEINFLQENVWLRLGFAALTMENWPTAGTAYRHYTQLQPSSFEAWNNLAKVYVKQGDKHRAHRALMEALKLNYDNWKLWENVVAVSMDTGHFEDVMRGVHRLLDLQKKFEDVEVLSLLVRAIVEDKLDADGNSAARLQKRALELMGRITATHQNNPEIWQLYADLSPTSLLRGQKLLKVYRGYTQKGNWPSSPETCIKVIQLALSVIQHSVDASREAEDKDKAQVGQLLSSARLTAQAVIRAATTQDWPQCQAPLQELQMSYDTITEYIKSLL